MTLSKIPKPSNPLSKWQDFAWATFHPSCGEVRLGPILYLAIHLNEEIRDHCFCRIYQNRNPSANFVRAKLGEAYNKKLSRWYNYRRAFHYTLAPPFLTFSDEGWQEFLAFLDPKPIKPGWFDEWEESE